jgi:hypothetical protein
MPAGATGLSTASARGTAAAYSCGPAARVSTAFQQHWCLLPQLQPLTRAPFRRRTATGPVRARLRWAKYKKRVGALELFNGDSTPLNHRALTPSSFCLQMRMLHVACYDESAGFKISRVSASPADVTYAAHFLNPQRTSSRVIGLRRGR